jgi:hypothetical protein
MGFRDGVEQSNQTVCAVQRRPFIAAPMEERTSCELGKD